jgi:hypothetical protein
MQLSLLSELPELDKKVFLGVFAQLYFDARRHRFRLRTIRGQQVPPDLHVGCATKTIARYPEGTIYKLDARLVRQPDRQPYLMAVNRRVVERALEFFEHNLRVQQGLPPAPKKRRKGSPKKVFFPAER